MNERTKAIIAGVVLLGICFGGGWMLESRWLRVERQAGRAEMKRWQDDYYRLDLSKPICAGEQCIVIPSSEWQRLVRESFHPIVTPPQPSKARKPRKPADLKTDPSAMMEMEFRDGVPWIRPKGGEWRQFSGGGDPCPCKAKPISCEGIFLEGYEDQVHWASTSRNRY